MLIDFGLPGLRPVEARRPRMGRAYAVLGYVHESRATLSALAAAVGACWPDDRWGRCGPSVVDYGDEVLEALLAAGASPAQVVEVGSACIRYLGDSLPRQEAIDEIAGNLPGLTEPMTST